MLKVAKDRTEPLKEATAPPGSTITTTANTEDENKEQQPKKDEPAPSPPQEPKQQEQQTEVKKEEANGVEASHKTATPEKSISETVDSSKKESSPVSFLHNCPIMSSVS